MDDQLKIFHSIVRVGFFVLIGKAFGAVREVVLAAHYGTNETIDTYLLVSSLASWPISVWLSTLMVIAVPLFVLKDKEAPSQIAQFMGELSFAGVAIGAAMALAFGVGIPRIASSGILGLSNRSVLLVNEIAVPLSLLLPLGLLIGVLSVRLLSRGRHVNTLLEGVPALCVTGAILALPTGNLSTLVWGTVIGFAVHAMALAWALPRSAVTFNVGRQARSPLWHQFMKAFALIALGQFVVGASGIVDQVMVAGLGVGSIAVLGYANRILALVLGLGATAVARATLPTFANLAQNDANLVASGKFWMKILFSLGLCVVVLGWIAAPWATEVLFERGLFTADDTAAVSTVLRFGLLQLPFYFSGIVAVQVLAARGRFDQITQVGLANVLIKIIANAILIRAFGIVGVMLATTGMYAVALVHLWRLAFIPSQHAPAAG